MQKNWQKCRTYIVYGLSLILVIINQLISYIVYLKLGNLTTVSSWISQVVRELFIKLFTKHSCYQNGSFLTFRIIFYPHLFFGFWKNQKKIYGTFKHIFMKYKFLYLGVLLLIFSLHYLMRSVCMNAKYEDSFWLIKANSYIFACNYHHILQFKFEAQIIPKEVLAFVVLTRY